jgi:hypothetical protein
MIPDSLSLDNPLIKCFSLTIEAGRMSTSDYFVSYESSSALSLLKTQITPGSQRSVYHSAEILWPLASHSSLSVICRDLVKILLLVRGSSRSISPAVWEVVASDSGPVAHLVFGLGHGLEQRQEQNNPTVVAPKIKLVMTIRITKWQSFTIRVSCVWKVMKWRRRGA